jgi:hypothetical protein
MKLRLWAIWQSMVSRTDGNDKILSIEHKNIVIEDPRGKQRGTDPPIGGELGEANAFALEVLTILYRKSGETTLADKYIETSPYDVEIRIQDYLDIFCLEKLKRTNETEVLQKSIIDYTNHDPSPSFNNILALKLLKEKGEAEAANTLVQKMGKSGAPGNKVNE